MIRYVASSRIADGKYTEALQYMVELANFYKKYEGLPPVEILTSLFGNTGVVIISGLYKDFTAYQKIYDQAVNDPEYFNFLKKAEGLFIEGSHTVNLMRVIEA